MYKILIVDDEEWIRDGIKNKLQKIGFNTDCISEASDGIEALEIIEKDLHDIVICDIRMQDMDGLELCKELSVRFPSVEKIIVSGYSEFDYAAKAIKEGVTSYLLKPIDIHELHNAVKSCIQKIEESRQNSSQYLGKILVTIYDISENYKYHFSSHRRVKEIMSSCIESLGTFSCCYVYLGETSNIPIGDVIATILECTEEFIFGEDMFIIKSGVLEYAILFWLPDNKDIHGTKKRIRNIAGKLNSQLLAKGIFGASFGIEVCVNDALKCLMSARSIMKHRVLIPEERIITREMTDQFTMPYNPRQQLIARYRHALELGEYHEICDVLRIMQKEVESFKVSYNALSNLYSSLVEIIAESGWNMPGTFEKDRDNYVKSLWQYNSVADMFGEIRDMCLSKINMTFIENIDYRKKLVNQVKEYIDNHYYEDISLEKLAERYYITPAYLSTIFKDIIGMNFLDYRLKVRIYNAKELLALKKYKIKTIAEMTGFKDQHYFSRVFKMVEGITPREFIDRV